MAEENGFENAEVPPRSRRAFVKTSAQVAVTAPAVAVLLNASGKRAMAQVLSPSQGSASHILDDFTFGNNEEDIDALNLHANFNPQNGAINLDDHLAP